jgi:hypothetical protein
MEMPNVIFVYQEIFATLNFYFLPLYYFFFNCLSGVCSIIKSSSHNSKRCSSIRTGTCEQQKYKLIYYGSKKDKIP